MDWKSISLFVRGYSFAARNMLAGMVINRILDLFAWLDYRILIILSMWHPDIRYRIKYLKRRGVKMGENVFVDLGVFIEITTPQQVIIEDYVSIGYGATIYAHDASLNTQADMPLRVKETRLCYNCAIATGSIIMPGVRVGEHCGVAPHSVVTHDVPDRTVVAGNPAKHLIGSLELGLAWQEDMKHHPEYYYDHPSPTHPPVTPFDEHITWRKEGYPIRAWTDLRTGTPFDYILEYKALQKKKRGEA
jgi:acetyltransferase-like isoleucine patch superfamily enzyme